MDERFGKKTKTKANKQTTKTERAAEVMAELQRLRDLIRGKVEMFYTEAEERDVETP